MDEALVSIIIPTHSGQKGIKKTVQSALNQTYKNIEVFVIDDNGLGTESQKATEAEIESFKSDSRFTYLVHEVNKNGSVARNTAMKLSKGRYIAFLDDDDSYKPDCIKKEIETFKRLGDDYGIVFVSFLQTREGMKDRVFTSNFDGDVLDEFLLGKIQSPSSIVMIKREVMDNVGLWDESFGRHQDWEYFTRVMCKYKAYGIHDVLVLRPIIERHSANNPNKYEQNRLHYLSKMKNIIDSRPKEIKTLIYDRHYRDIAKTYIKNKKIIKGIKWSLKTSSPLKSMTGLFFNAKAYLKNRSK